MKLVSQRIKNVWPLVVYVVPLAAGQVVPSEGVALGAPLVAVAVVSFDGAVGAPEGVVTGYGKSLPPRPPPVKFTDDGGNAELGIGMGTTDKVDGGETVVGMGIIEMVDGAGGRTPEGPTVPISDDG